MLTLNANKNILPSTYLKKVIKHVILKGNNVLVESICKNSSCVQGTELGTLQLFHLTFIIILEVGDVTLENLNPGEAKTKVTQIKSGAQL